MKPNKLQEQALKSLANTTAKSGIVVMPTGTGKTLLSVLWFKKILEKEPKATLLFICHNNDILAQANEKEFQVGLKTIGITEEDCGYYNANKKEHKQITFGTIQTLARNISILPKDKYDYIIVDEAHHYQAKTFKPVLKYFKSKFMLGLTATPGRMDGLSIKDVFGEIIFEADTSTAIKDGLLSKFKYYNVENDIDFSKIPSENGKYKVSDLNKHLCISEYDKAILDEYKKYAKRSGFKKTIVFCATVEHAHRMKDVFEKNNIKSAVFTGTRQLTFNQDKTSFKFIPTKERKQILDDFKKGRYEVIFVRDLFNEGVDVPDADCIMFLRPTQSNTIFTQQLGRGLRRAKDKKYLTCLDFTGNSDRCQLNFIELGKILKIDIKEHLKNISKELSKNMGGKEFIIYSLGCEITLTPKKINILNQKIFRIKNDYKVGGKLTKENIIERYNTLKKELGRVPLVTELKIKWDRLKPILKQNWFAFVKSMGDKPINGRGNRINVVKENIDEKTFSNLKQTYEKLKKQYNVNTLKTEHLKKGEGANLKNGINKYFGNLNAFKKAIGEEKPFFQDRNCSKDYKKIKRKYIIKAIKVKSNKENIKFFNTKLINLEKFEVLKPIINNYKKPIRHELGKTISNNNFINSNEKDKFRPLVIRHISDDDIVLLLESPQLKAIKEIEKQKIKPKKIIIPNCFEFKELCQALNEYKTDLKIEVYNATALVYLINSAIKFDYMFLDYNGNFENYSKDLEITLEKYKDLKLFVTYNIFDLKNGGNNYFAKVFDFIQTKRKDMKLYIEETQKYKKMFYNVGVKLGRYSND
jgi:superfamily II DNA or RNA helicase